MLLNVAQFKLMVPSSCIYYLPENTLIVYEQIVLSTSAILSLQQKPLDIVRWNPFSGLCQRVSPEESAAYLSPHPLKAKAAGRKVVMLPLILFADDTSGNKSKKWHKFKSCSDRMSALDMTTPIADVYIVIIRYVYRNNTLKYTLANNKLLAQCNDASSLNCSFLLD